MDRKWQREIHALELIIVAPWPLDAQFVSKCKDVQKIEPY